MSGTVLRTRKAMSSRLDPCFLGGHIEKVSIMLRPVDETP